MAREHPSDVPPRSNEGLPPTRPMSRRTFLAGAAGAGAAIAAGGLTGIGAAVVRAGVEDRPWFEKSIPQLQTLMRNGRVSSRELTRAYLNRIAKLNPTLGAVIETNPQALAIARRLDDERRRGRVRGPLHGIPILVKDNIATDDAMQTTAGSLALVGTRVPDDAVLVDRLRRAGAVVLGKTNLSEWANFRGFPPPDFPFATNYLNGWSARGGFTHNPYLQGFDPCGSSSGSGVAPAVNMCAAAVGTETDGSIVCPAGNSGIVGLKPTIGLISQQGVIPIAHSQDSAGPMTRTVMDTAILMNVMKSPFGPVAGRRLPGDYRKFVDPKGLRGARIGIERRQFLPEYFALPEINAVVEDAIVEMERAGAVIVDPVDTGDTFEWFDAEFLVLMHEFKRDIRLYLQSLRQPQRPKMRNLGDLIDFNIAHCEEEMEFFGQEIFEMSNALSGDPDDRAYRQARRLCLRLTRREGIDRVMRQHDLDAVLSPSYAFGSSAPAAAGYPVMAVPVGITEPGYPAGVWLYAGFLQEPQLIKVAAGIEALFGREQPRFLGAIPADPPDAGICDMGTAAAQDARVAEAREKLAAGKLRRPLRI
jgi:amidase